MNITICSFPFWRSNGLFQTLDISKNAAINSYIYIYIYMPLYIYDSVSLAHMCAKSHQSYLTLCNPMDCSPPGSSAYVILQARILEWVAMSSSRGSS